MIRQLNINNYETFLVLGDDLEEKLTPRHIVINISVRFPIDVCACRSDHIDDAVCYRSLLIFLGKELNNARFNLIERAAQYLYDALKKYLSEHLSEHLKEENLFIHVEVVKPSPLPNQKLESASFICSDW
ncbi:MAG: dihydroneopterin aldolase [Holosporaceae bacterium]|jgi:FolB domain-containing protein|nr:dihydroneopterin aldolase [Holosporaceae bacterium]